jgi:hypothetical protein
VSQTYKGKLQGRSLDSRGHTRVAKLPRVPTHKASYWLNSPNGRREYTHQLFKFPAKFHPPVVRWALATFGRRGSVLLDPFTGSGTGQVEALVRGISSVGIDIDPLACLIAKVKTTPLDPARLEQASANIRSILAPFLRLHADREVRRGCDISWERYERESISLSIPSIPNIAHWFRRYVIVDLARILWSLGQTQLSLEEREFFRVCMASTVRRVSNADPAPVSGLEVTSIQAELNRERTIRVFDLFFAKVQLAISGMCQLWNAYQSSSATPVSTVIRGDVLQLPLLLDDSLTPTNGFPLVVTSPPYCRAVEYSRRHRLEMYWMGFVKSATEQLQLAHTYIGRNLVRGGDWNDESDFGIESLDGRLAKMTELDPTRARGIRHYFHSMRNFFHVLSMRIRKSGTVVCIVGNSRCCEIPIPTADILVEVAADVFALKLRFSYAVRNHYMQYGLWNGDGIKEEHVLVFKPR